MNTALAAMTLALAAQAGVAGTTNTPSPRAALLEVRNLVYDAMYRNDASGLTLAIESLDRLADRAGSQERPYVDYYLSLAFWGLSSSQLQADDAAAALKSGRAAVKHARDGVDARRDDPEFHAALANALIVVAILDRPNFEQTAKELVSVRKQALSLGPASPRVVIMDAGLIYNSPPELGGSRERGLSRWREALTLFEREAGSSPGNTLEPRWGHALAWGWFANLLLAADSGQIGAAREAAATALRMRPDFWYVKEQLLPRLKSMARDRALSGDLERIVSRKARGYFARSRR